MEELNEALTTGIFLNGPEQSADFAPSIMNWKPLPLPTVTEEKQDYRHTLSWIGKEEIVWACLNYVRQCKGVHCFDNMHYSLTPIFRPASRTLPASCLGCLGCLQTLRKPPKNVHHQKRQHITSTQLCSVWIDQVLKLGLSNS